MKNVFVHNNNKHFLDTLQTADGLMASRLALGCFFNLLFVVLTSHTRVLKCSVQLRQQLLIVPAKLLPSDGPKQNR